MSRMAMRLLLSCFVLLLLAPSPFAAETGARPEVEQLPLTAENLAGEWYYYDLKSDSPHITAWELNADGTFRGGVRNPDPYWQFRGTWELKDGELHSVYTWSTREMSGEVDRDKILELSDQYMVLKNVSSNKTIIYWRGWNAALGAEAHQKMKQKKERVSPR